MSIKLKFFGSSNNSAIVKQALIQAGYTLVGQLDKADLVISADYGQKLPAGGLNLHPSLLPKYRGPTPVPYQILNQEKQAGISIIKMTGRFDAGPLIAQESVPILPNDTSPELLTRCFSAGAKLLIKILPDYLNNKITQKNQTESQATFTRKFTKADGFIAWGKYLSSRQSADLGRRLRALYPWPGVWTTLPDKKILKLLPNNQIQLEGKAPISWKQFLAGHQHLLNQ
ncbi:MAG: formyltransferase family protein [Candidatus Beckwithbacteria bacterium]